MVYTRRYAETLVEMFGAEGEFDVDLPNGYEGVVEELIDMGCDVTCHSPSPRVTVLCPLQLRNVSSDGSIQ